MLWHKLISAKIASGGGGGVVGTGFDISTAVFSQNFSVASEETTPLGIAFNTDGTKMFIVGDIGNDVNEYTLSTGFDVSTATYSQNFSVSAQETIPTGIAFNTDGTKMFVLGASGLDVNEYTLGTGFDVSTATYSQNFSVSAQDTFPAGIAFNNDGTKMFIIGVSGDDVNEYTLGTGFDVSTATYSQNFSVSAQDTFPAGIAFNNDGTKMFIIGVSGDDVNEYTLGTGFDVSTATYSQNFSVASEEISPRGIAFNTDGTKMFIVGTSGDDVNEYSLETGFDISTAFYSQGFSVASQELFPQGIAFNNDGTKMFVVGNFGDNVNEYTLGTGFDVSTATYSQNFSVSAQELDPTGIAFNTDGTKMFIVGSSGDDVNEYALGTGFNISTATYSQNFSVSAQEINPQEIAFNNDGTKMFIIGFDGDDVNEYTLGTGFDVSTASYSQNFSVASEELNPAGMAFNNNGTKMFIVGYSGDDVNEYTLGTAFDISTATYSQNFSVSAQETAPGGIAFNNNGTKMFIVGSGGDTVFEYRLAIPGAGFDISNAVFNGGSYGYFSVADQQTSPEDLFFKPDGTKLYIIGVGGDEVDEYNLSSAWDIFTASHVQTFNVASEDSNPTALFFKSDGTKMYVLGDTGDDVNEYDLSSAWDISTASYLQNFSVATEETSPGGLFFKPDGTKMYVVGRTGDNVNEYDLSSAWDISTASYLQNFSVAAQESNPEGIFFKSDGTKMYVIGFSGDDVNEYDLSSAWDVSSASYLQNFSIVKQATTPYGLFFKPDGTKLYIVGTVSKAIWAYTLSSAWDVSTASWDAPTQNYFSVAGEENFPSGIAFNNDGTKMFILGDAGNDVNEYTLGTGFDVSTASYFQNFSVSAQDSFPQEIAFNTDGTKMFIVGDSNDAVYEYTLGTGFDVSTATYSQNFSVSAQETTPQGIAFNTDGTKMFIVGTDGDAVYEYTLGTGFDVSTATYSQNFSVASESLFPKGIAFKTDGTKMFIVDSFADNVSEYTLGTGFDVSTASYSQNFSVASEETNPTGIAFNNYGTKMFIVGSTKDVVWAYEL